MREALLLMDFQRRQLEQVPAAKKAADVATTAAVAARAAGVPVIHVRIAFRQDHPEISTRIQAFGGLLGTDIFVEDNPHTEFAVAVRAGEVVVTKRFISAFWHSDLDITLRAGNIEKVTLAGISTSGVVLSTVRDALELGYRTTVLADGCADPDPEVHRVLLGKVIPPTADVLMTQEWAGSLTGA